MTQLTGSRQRAMPAGHRFMSHQRSIAQQLRRISLACCLVLSIVAPVLLMQARPIAAQTGASTQRVIRGKVYNAGDTPEVGAVVYLKNMKSLEIKTCIAQDATYRFGQLGSSDDYQLWAEFGGHKSKVKNISGFDSKKVFDIALHVEDK